jgi:hypothetical protein
MGINRSSEEVQFIMGLDITLKKVLLPSIITIIPEKLLSNKTFRKMPGEICGGLQANDM